MKSKIINRVRERQANLPVPTATQKQDEVLRQLNHFVIQAKRAEQKAAEDRRAKQEQAAKILRFRYKDVPAHRQPIECRYPSLIKV